MYNGENCKPTDRYEKILEKSNSRFSIFPIEYPDIWQLYKDSLSTFWTVEEINLSKDKEDWEKMTEDERFFIKNVLAFFASSDGVVMENLVERFMNDIGIAEARSFYSYQIFNENIHNETYSLLIDTYIDDEEEKHRLLNSIDNHPIVSLKGEWALKWISDKDSSFAKRLIAFAIVEGVFFSGSFCAIYWLKKRGLMPGLTFSNELISRDESQHTDFACLLYSKLEHKLETDEFKRIMIEAVFIEIDFITKALPCHLLGMNKDLMSDYIKFVSDRLCVQLGYSKIWNVTNPFDFMELISLRPKSNFFEIRVGEYTKGDAKGDDFEVDEEDF